MLPARTSGFQRRRRRRVRTWLLLAAVVALGCGPVEEVRAANDTGRGLRPEPGSGPEAARLREVPDDPPAPAADPRCEEELDYDACGGPLEGTWKVDYACGRFRVEIDRIFGAATSFACWIPGELDREVRGTVTYRDGREHADLALRSRTRFTVPDPCAASLAPELSPAAFCEELSSRLPAEGRTGGCVLRDGRCTCDYLEVRRQADSRPYLQELPGIVDFPGDGDAGFTYCVGGRRLVQSRGDLFLHLSR